MKHHDEKKLGEQMAYLAPHCYSSSKEVRQELKQGRDLEAGADAEAMEECCLLVCSLQPAQPVFL